MKSKLFPLVTLNGEVTLHLPESHCPQKQTPYLDPTPHSLLIRSGDLLKTCFNFEDLSFTFQKGFSLLNAKHDFQGNG